MLLKSTYQTIQIHADTPEKPAMGKPCNGCGVCCAAEPCPVSLVLLWPHKLPCRALEWSEVEKRYFCGMVMEPSHYLRWLPKSTNQFLIKIFKRWIAADQHCDADVTFMIDSN